MLQDINGDIWVQIGSKPMCDDEQESQEYKINLAKDVESKLNISDSIKSFLADDSFLYVLTINLKWHFLSQPDSVFSD